MWKENLQLVVKFHKKELPHPSVIYVSKFDSDVRRQIVIFPGVLILKRHFSTFFNAVSEQVMVLNTERWSKDRRNWAYMKHVPGLQTTSELLDLVNKDKIQFLEHRREEDHKMFIW